MMCHPSMQYQLSKTVTTELKKLMISSRSIPNHTVFSPWFVLELFSSSMDFPLKICDLSYNTGREWTYREQDNNNDANLYPHQHYTLSKCSAKTSVDKLVFIAWQGGLELLGRCSGEVFDLHSVVTSCFVLFWVDLVFFLRYLRSVSTPEAVLLSMPCFLTILFALLE